MEYRFLGRTGVRVSMLGLGTMAFGGDADAATSAALYAHARDAGINLFDCADVYAGGESERVLGRLMADHRDDVVIASKAYFPTGSKGPNDRGNSRYHLVRAVEASLQRLNTDRIDLYFLHRFDDETDLAESLRALDDLVRQGKILYPALSNFAAWQAQRAVDLCERHGWARPVCVQPMYNLAKRQAEVEILPQAKANDLAVMPYSPLGGGLLSGKYGAERRPDAGRLVDNPMYTTRYADPEHFAVAERFTAYAADRGVPPVALAVAWVAHHPAVTCALVGGRSLAQLEGSLAAADLPMDADLRAAVSALSAAPPPATDRNEERSANNYGTR